MKMERAQPRMRDEEGAVKSMYGVLEEALGKFDGQKGWGVIFSRVLVGFLDDEDIFSGFHSIIASPTYIGEGGRSWDHTRSILEAADLLSSALALPPRSAAGRADCADSSDIRPAALSRQETMAETELRAALLVPDSSRIEGHRILVFDDVFIYGLTLREIAKTLIENGADTVCGVTLVRQPYG